MNYKRPEEIFIETYKEVGVYIRRARDVHEKVWDYHQHGDTFGEYTGVTKLNAHLRWRPGFLYTFSGWPGSGKSEFLNYMMILRAKAGEKIVMYSPGVLPSTGFS